MAIYDARFVKGLHSDNPWWSGERWVDNIPRFKRSDFNHYVRELEEPRVHILIGPRRVGKTTLMMQIIEYLIYVKKVSPKSILFMSLERPFYELKENKVLDAINFYEEQILGKSIQDTTETIHVFIDEAHYDNTWSRLLKQYVDQKLPIYSIVSGSSAASINKDKESAAGRFSLHQMVTMKFRDIVRFRSPENNDIIRSMSIKLRNALTDAFQKKDLTEYEKVVKEVSSLPNPIVDVLKACLNEYLLKGGYPEFYATNKEWKDISRYYQTNVFDVILQKDVVTIANIRQYEKLRSLMVFIANNTARSLNREKISRVLNFSGPITVDNYIDALSEAFLVRTSAKYKKDGYPSTKARKYYVADTGLRNAVLGVDEIETQEDEKGALLETAVFNHILRLMFSIDHQIRHQGFYYSEETEKDIILDLSNSSEIVVPIEVKNGKCGSEDIKKLKVTINKLRSPFGLVICKEQIGIQDNILMVPGWIFLLTC